MRIAIIAAALACAFPPSVRAADSVGIAYIGGTADVGFYIADAKGYLKQEGIQAKFEVFDSSARMVAPLATGEIDVGSGAVGAGTYNAFERGVTLRAVADKSRNKGVYSYQGLMVRKDLWESGAVRKIADLKGRKFALTANGSNEWAVLNEAAGMGGIALADIDTTILSMPQQVAAYAGKAIDASFLPEPFRSAAIKSGVAVEMTPVTALRDDDVTGVVVYGQKFMAERPDVAHRVTRAYVRGLRDYVDALKDARLAGPGADEVADIMARYSTVKDKDVLRAVIPHYVDPNGEVGASSLRKDWDFFKSQGLIKGDVTVEQLIDKSWVEQAVRELGPYRPKS